VTRALLVTTRLGFILGWKWLGLTIALVTIRLGFILGWKWLAVTKALLVTIRLGFIIGRKWLAVTRAQVYSTPVLITTVKHFREQAPGEIGRFGENYNPSFN